jgi:hypothetical protein
MYRELTEKERVLNALKGPQFDRKLHGSLYDRGMADSYYGRIESPHYGGIGGSTLPHTTELTADERAEYLAGYEYNERYGDKKSWD